MIEQIKHSEYEPEPLQPESANWAQMKLAEMIFPDLDAEKAFFAFIENEREFSKEFRKIVEDNPNIKERIIKRDESVLEEIKEALLAEDISIN